VASPTDVRVESIAPTVAVLRWTDADANDVEIHISFDGDTFEPLQTVAATQEEFFVTELEPNTRYWFKLTQDAGATFSDIVNVWTHTCLITSHARIAPRLPRFGESVDPQRLNKLAEETEEYLRTPDQPSVYNNCFVCPSEGRIILDCSLGCQSFTVGSSNVIIREVASSATSNRSGPPSNLEKFVQALMGIPSSPLDHSPVR